MTTAGESARLSDMPATFDPSGIEGSMYQRWKDAGYFSPDVHPDGEPFVIVMPPPNVTGELHVGHALFVSLQDLMIRWRRMNGDAALWMPGADHAGIAGQWVVERLIAQEGLTRHDLGREAFVDRIWEYMDRLRGRIEQQTSILGASCDWDRYTFTMDSGPSRAVRTVFKHLYDKGLIYRGSRLISWCPRCMTALSDLEVVHKEVDGHLWNLAYPVEGEEGRTIVVATTRPETMLGDTAVAVHPDDDRYRDLIGKFLILPILGRRIPVVADDAVDMAFGSGAVKVTPAHDPNDFEIAKRNQLPAIVILNPDGTLNSHAGPFEGMQIGAARAAVVERLQADGALLGSQPHKHAVGHCDRCGTVVEPTISEQWFVEMADLAAPAIDAARSGELKFVPERFKGVYLNWMENIHDWCISRQLWWGHRIPVWYCQSCREMTVTVEEHLAECPACGGPVEQDPDVLDTWFSSGLWPFSTLGWPDDTADLRRYYPSDVMETGYEILFFWVARMVFFGIEIMGELPFHTVYLHGTVRDTDGLKMSKTKGNVLDPTEITETYGADALRFALVTQGSPGLDMRLSMTLVESSRNFINKMWNATRFALRAIEEAGVELDATGPVRPTGELPLPDRWILSRLDSVTETVDRLFASYLFGEAGRQLREFIWSELCDWYIEASKVRLRGTEEERRQVAQTLAYTMERSMRLLHPFMPFATESMWQALPHNGKSVMIASWPTLGHPDPAAEESWNRLSDLIVKIRNARAESGVEAGKWVPARIHAGDRAEEYRTVVREISTLARLEAESLQMLSEPPNPDQGDLVVVGDDIVAVLPMSGLIDISEERERLSRDLVEARLEKSRAEAQLGNSSFVDRAPANVVQVQRDRLANAEEKIAILSFRLAEIAR